MNILYQVKKYYDSNERRYFWSLQTIDGKPTSCISYDEELAYKILNLLNAEVTNEGGEGGKGWDSVTDYVPLANR